MKKLFAILILTAMMLSIAGCEKKEEQVTESSAIEIARNDFYGGYTRLEEIKEKVKNSISFLEEHNYVIQTNNPDNYWAESEFYHLDFFPLEEEALDHVYLLNEGNEFSELQNAIASNLSGLGFSNISVVRIEKDKYRITYTGNFIDRDNWETNYRTRMINCTYDPAYNRLQILSQFVYNDIADEDFIYEYAELPNNYYALQNDTERLLVHLTEDYDVDSFYYSKLREPSEEEYAKLVEAYKREHLDEYGIEGILATSDFDLSLLPSWRYTAEENESLFQNIDKCNEDWVYEAYNLKFTVKFENDVLSVWKLNDLTKKEQAFEVKKIINAPPGEVPES